jgi:hypothetical protein
MAIAFDEPVPELEGVVGSEPVSERRQDPERED